MRPLNVRQKRFAAEYIIDLNASAAALRAGYIGVNIHPQASRLLSYDNVKAEIQRLMDKRAVRTNITQDRVLEEIAKLAFFDVRQLYDENGDLIPIHKLPDDVAAAINGIDPEKQKVKLTDKKGALELLGKHLKIFTDVREVKHSGEITMRALLGDNDQGGLPPLKMINEK